MEHRIRVFATSLCITFVLAGSAHAQQRATLDQTEALLKDGQAEQARVMLERWKKDHTNVRSSSDDGLRAAYLSARLTSDARDAEDAYLSIAISAPPSSAYVPEALLRVGQAEMLNGSPANAVPYLKRLVDNYPNSEFAAAGAELLKRAGSSASASARAGVSASEKVVPASKPSTIPATTTLPAANPVATATNVRYTIQVAAFREMSNARGVARALANAGFNDVRLATVAENTLIRVRVGKFDSASAATQTLATLKSKGYKAVVVADAAREQIVRD